MKYNFLIIKKNSKDVFFKNIENHYIMSYYKLDTRNLILRILIKIKSPFINLLFSSNWKKIIKEKKANAIIMFDNGFSEMVPKYIKNKNKEIKTILWFWNPINELSKKYLHCKDLDEIWSFDLEEVKKFNMKYNTQFFTKKIKKHKKKICNEILYLGNAKNIKEEILSLKNKVEELGLQTNFIIIEDKKDYMSYDKYLELLSESNCILDYNEKGQSGLTLRPMEALFLEKKLITNNKDIKNYDFYNPSNIFILGENNIEDIKEFINKPYEKVEQKIIDYYDFEQWLSRFEVQDK